MADWQVVRYDPTYPEPLDPEIISLCDALNAAGVVTLSSCSGHGRAWPYVQFVHSSDARIESLARFLLRHTERDFAPFRLQVQKEICLDGCVWSLKIHLTHVYADTPAAVGLAEAEAALAQVTRLVEEWAAEVCS